MLQVVSSLKGFKLKGSDGHIGTIIDFLFDDRAWRIRWLVVDTGGWFSDREILVRPSSIDFADCESLELHTDLTKAELNSSPESLADLPVSLQCEHRLYSRFGWDPLFGSSGDMALAFSPPPLFSNLDLPLATQSDPVPAVGNPRLRSTTTVTGYHAHALDGVIGHVDDFLIDHESWSILYVIIDTKDWWFGQHVLLSVSVVREIVWSVREMRLEVNRDQVRAGPPWEPLQRFDQAYATQLHDHYGWPSYNIDTSETGVRPLAVEGFG